MTNRTMLSSRHQPGGLFIVDDLEQHPGHVWFVDSGMTGCSNTTGYGRSPDTPFATLDYAIGRCTANNGDVIYVMPGHSEIYTATAGALGFDADVAGIKIIGLGWGDDRPEFVLNHANAQITIGACDIWLENLRFTAGVTGVVAGVQVETTNQNTVFKNCEWYYSTDDTTGDDFIIALEIETGCNDTHVIGCKFIGEPATLGPNTAISLTAGVSHRVQIRNCEFYGDYAVAAIDAPTAICQHLMVIDNFCYLTNSGEPFLQTFSGTTGVVKGTHGFALANAFIVDAIMADTMAHCENYITNTIGVTAVVAGAAGSAVLDVDAA